MVAHVALATNSMDSTNVHISGLQFQGRSRIESNINGGTDSRVVIGYSGWEAKKQVVKMLRISVDSSVAYFIQFEDESVTLPT